MQGILVLTVISAQILFVYGWITEVPVQTVLGLTPLLYAFGFAAVSVMVDLRLLTGAFFQWAGFVAAILLPEWTFEILGASGLLSAATTWKWPEPARSEERTTLA